MAKKSAIDNPLTHKIISQLSLGNDFLMLLLKLMVAFELWLNFLYNR